MDWVELFVVFAVCHLAGDFLVQTDWQARNKHGGMRHGGERRRALGIHIATYLLAFAPALFWVGEDIGIATAVIAGAAIAVPHFVQDDGAVVSLWMRRLKHTDPDAHPNIAISVDQSLHAIALLLTALAVTA